MNKRATLKWFTLLEMLIVMVIIGILAVVLTESYIFISKTALRIEKQKNISEESLILTQIFQSIADEATIDYSKYNDELKNSNWYTNILYLKSWEWENATEIKIYTKWAWCLDLNANFEPDENWNYPDISEDIKNAKDCKLILEQEGEEGEGEKTLLNTSWKIIVSKVMFRVIPYDSDEKYFDSTQEWGALIEKLHQPAFWMFIHLYSPFYQPTWTNKIDLPLQLFFNLNL